MMLGDTSFTCKKCQKQTVYANMTIEDLSKGLLTCSACKAKELGDKKLIKQTLKLLLLGKL